MRRPSPSRESPPTQENARPKKIWFGADCYCQGAEKPAKSLLQPAKKGGGIFVKFVKIVALCAFAVASLGLGACASKAQPAPATTGYSK